MDVVQREVAVDRAFKLGFGDAGGNAGDLARPDEAAIGGNARIEHAVCGLGTGILDPPRGKRIEKAREAMDGREDLQQGDKAPFGQQAKERRAVLGL